MADFISNRDAIQAVGAAGLGVQREAMRELHQRLSSLEPLPLPTPSQRNRQKAVEGVANTLLMLAGLVSVLTTVAIAVTLIVEATPFFAHVSLTEFLFGTRWAPAFANPSFGVLPLLMGTVMTSLIALLVAIPMGTTIAVLLSEYAPAWLRETVKPILELLAAVPTVVYGYFALLLVTPILEAIIPGLSGANMLSAGLVMGMMIIPYVSSLSEDALRSVPNTLREGALGLGATRLQMTRQVIMPAATSGICAAYVLAISRAIGETMVVAIAAGQMPNFTADPREGAATMTAFIVSLALGDLEHGSIAYQSIFAVGLYLFVVTFAFNVLAFWLRSKFREAY